MAEVRQCTCGCLGPVFTDPFTGKLVTPAEAPNRDGWMTEEQVRRVIANHESGAQLTGVGVWRQMLWLMREVARREWECRALRKKNKNMRRNVLRLLARLRKCGGTDDR